MQPFFPFSGKDVRVTYQKKLLKSSPYLPKILFFHFLFFIAQSLFIVVDYTIKNNVKNQKTVDESNNEGFKIYLQVRLTRRSNY